MGRPGWSESAYVRTTRTLHSFYIFLPATLRTIFVSRTRRGLASRRVSPRGRAAAAPNDTGGTARSFPQRDARRVPPVSSRGGSPGVRRASGIPREARISVPCTPGNPL
eukprot:1176769-Prorocentrum_minimum.AAC.3